MLKLGGGGYGNSFTDWTLLCEDLKHGALKQSEVSKWGMQLKILHRTI